MRGTWILRVLQRAFWYLIYPNTLRYKTGLKNDQTILLANREQGWCQAESTRLPQVRPRFESWHRCHTWIKFVVGSLPCSERFFLRQLHFCPLLKNDNFQISIWNPFIFFVVSPCSNINKIINITRIFLSEPKEEHIGNSFTFRNILGYPLSTLSKSSKPKVLVISTMPCNQ